MIGKRQYQILQRMLKAEDYLSSETLAEAMQVSNRTIRRDMEQIEYKLKDRDAEIDFSKARGYRLQGAKEEIYRLSQETAAFLEGAFTGDSSEGRIQQIIQVLLEEGPISVEDMAEELKYSVSSVQKTMGAVKKRIGQYSLTIRSKPHYGSEIVGKEIDQRYLQLDYCIKRLNNVLERIPSNVDMQDAGVIETVMLRHLDHLNIVISDQDFNKLQETILIAVARNRKNKEIPILDIHQESKNENYFAIYEMMKAMEQELGLAFADTDFWYVSHFSGFMLYDYRIKDSSNLANLDNEMLRFLLDVLNEIRLITGHDFGNDFQFINAMMVHLSLLRKRIWINDRIANPMLAQIRSRYQVEMNLASFLAKRLEDYFQIQVSEDEIGFLAMHFGASRARKKKERKMRVAVLCHFGIGTAQLLAERIRKSIQNIEIAGVYPIRGFQPQFAEDIDCIVATQKLDQSMGSLPVIVIEDILSDQSMKRIHDFIHIESKQKELLVEMFHPDAYYHLEAKTSKEAIEELAAKMTAKGLIDGKITHSILEREQISATDIGNLVAIPHTTLHGDHRSIIGVGILREPIMWSREKVRLIFMLCFNLAEVENIQVFKYMYDLIENDRVVNRFIESKNYEEFQLILNQEKSAWI